MSQQDPLANFLGDLAKKIKVNKEHKDIMDAVYASASGVNTVKEQEDPFAGFLKKIGNTIAEKLPEPVQLKPKIKTEEKKIEPEPVESQEIESTTEQEIPQEQPTEVSVPTDDNKSAKALAQKIRDAIDAAKNKALDKTKPATDTEDDEQISSYINELEKIKDTGTVQQKEEATTSLKELKKYIDKTVQDYARRILDLGSGGGTVAVQYAKGGTMDGDLNINGHILSGGKNIANYFGTGGGGGGDPAVNALVHTNSGFWNEAYTNLVTNSAAYLLSGTEVYLGDIPTASGSWNSTYTTVNAYSGTWSTGIQNLSFNESNAELSISNGNTISLSALSGNDINSILNYFSTNNVTISGLTVTQNLSVGGTIYSSATALVIAEYETLIGNGVNTSFTVNHNLNTDNIQVVVYDVGNNIASYPSIQILNSNSVSIGFSFVPPLNYYRVLVFGTVPSNQINAYGEIYTFYTTATGFGDIPTLSGNWNSTYTTVNSNSACWELGCQAYTNLVTNSAAYLLSGTDVYLGDIPTLSGDWNSTYTTVQNNSASWDFWINLPVPKIYLSKAAASVPYLNSPGSDISLKGYPYATTQGLTQDLLNKYSIFIEMVMFKKVGRRVVNDDTQPGRGTSYVAPGASTVKPWGSFWSRGSTAFSNDPAFERHNQLPVTGMNEVISLAPCLDYRFKQRNINYLDATSINNNDYRSVELIIPSWTRSGGVAIRRFGYQRNYKCMYIAFRYIAWDPTANGGLGQIVEGPLSKTIRIANTSWPFRTDHYNSSLKGFPVVSLHPGIDQPFRENFTCKFV